MCNLIPAIFPFHRSHLDRMSLRTTIDIHATVKSALCGHNYSFFAFYYIRHEMCPFGSVKY